MNDGEAERAAAAIALVASAPRVQLIQALIKGEHIVGDLAKHIGQTQSATSQHLARLKRAGLIVQRKHKQLRYCILVRHKVDLLLRLIKIAEDHATSVR